MRIQSVINEKLWPFPQQRNTMFRLGSDPEVFLQDVEGKFISAIDKVGGSKEFPLQLEGMKEGFTVQEDNVAVEFGIPPAINKWDFVSHILDVQLEVKKKLPKLSFSRLSCTVFPEEQMQDARAFVFGCEPDYNAWTGKINRFKKPNNPFLRSAGGHVHVGMDKSVDKDTMIKYMDLYLGVGSVLLDDDGVERRQLYGKAGACRYKPYGVEYRTLSNFWIFEEDLIEWVWDNSYHAFMHAQDDTHDIDRYRNLIVDCINNNNKRLAEKLIKEFGIEGPNVH